MEKSYQPSVWKIIEEHWYDYQGKRILEQKCSFDSLSLICVPLFDVSYYSNLKQLFILQKKALRIMCGKSRRETTENIFSELKILKFTDINTYLTGRFMYKFYKKNVPEIFTCFFQCNSSVHGYSTRQREYLHVPPVKSNLSQFSIRYRGVVVWNANLKSKINPDVSDFVFVKSFKAHILDKKIAVS